MANRPCANCGATMINTDSRRRTCSNNCRVALQRNPKPIEVSETSSDFPSHFARQMNRIPVRKRLRVQQWFKDNPDEMAKVLPHNVDLELIQLTADELYAQTGDMEVLPAYGFPADSLYESVLEAIVTDDDE